jgi:predicted phosphoadenosine phosphosulfate sulfurtransferase
VASAIEDAVSALRGARSTTSRVLVAYSDGKDSRVVMDLAARHFDHVEGFFMYFAPDLQCTIDALDAASRRWGVKIHMIPHWSACMAMKYGAYCNQRWDRDDVPESAEDFIAILDGGVLTRGKPTRKKGAEPTAEAQ